MRGKRAGEKSFRNSVICCTDGDESAKKTDEQPEKRDKNSSVASWKSRKGVF